MEKLRLAKQCDRWDEDRTQLIHSLRRYFEWEEHALFPRAIRHQPADITVSHIGDLLNYDFSGLSEACQEKQIQPRMGLIDEA